MPVPVSFRRLCYPIGSVSAAILWRLELVFRVFELGEAPDIAMQVVDFQGVRQMAECGLNGYKIELIQRDA
ncbi:MAG: hypothetical protein K2Y15_04860 [Burkholderiaceae bacterium]|nr:hypothetical protein [Burkholderiaceae bacterium]